MLDVSKRIESTVARFVRDLPAERGRVVVAGHDSEGVPILRGATDTSRRTIDPTHSAFGYTSADLTDLRAALRAAGVVLSLQETAAALMQCAYEGGEVYLTAGERSEARRAKERAKKAARRAWARERGYCIVCCKNAASYRSDGSQCSTCSECQAKANAAKRKRAR